MPPLPKPGRRTLSSITTQTANIWMTNGTGQGHGCASQPIGWFAYLDEQIFTPFLGHCEVVLEVGPGGDRFTEILLPKCHKLIAADTSSSMLKMLQKRLSHCFKIEYVLLDGLGLSKIPDSSVDAVFSFDVFVHLQHWDMYNYLSEIRRILRQGGKVVIHHANTFSDLGWALFLKQVKPSLNQHKLMWTHTLMTPDIMHEFARHTDLQLIECITDVDRCDCISLMQS